MEQNIPDKYYSYFHNFYYPVFNISRLATIYELPALQFEDLLKLLDRSPIITKDGQFLRKIFCEENALNNILNCLNIFSHHKSDSVAEIDILNASVNHLGLADNEGLVLDKISDIYWAKGLGNSAYLQDVEDNFIKKKYEEHQVTLIFEILSSFVNPGDQKLSMENSNIPSLLEDFQKSCIIPVLCSYLKNDSVLDTAKHVPLYRAILKFLRGLSVTPQLIKLLTTKQENNAETITTLLFDLATCVDDYANKIFKQQPNENDDDEMEYLIKEIQETVAMVKSVTCTDNKIDKDENQTTSLIDYEMGSTIKEKYLAAMKGLQFDSFEMIVESEKNDCQFTVPYSFKNMIDLERMSIGRGNPKRMKRINQELAILEKSLPLSYNSSIFLRYDANRMDVMKILIIGPTNTPYANGCFEFDVFFPPDYPDSPLIVIFTTGFSEVPSWFPFGFPFGFPFRVLLFNPNFHPDGKVCLSVLNTWPGPAEARWNSETSSLLQILVTIQSFVLVSEPYFNEPGYERIRGTPQGDIGSRKYNNEVRLNCIYQAMLNQISNPSPCFKDVIQKHFWFKQNEICEQIEKWIAERSHQAGDEFRVERGLNDDLTILQEIYEALECEFEVLPDPQSVNN